MEHRPDQKTAVITGASDGIGAAAARELAGRGWRVVVVGRNPEKTAAVAGSIGADWYTVDFSRLEDVRRLAAALQDRYPRIDLLANNAGAILRQRTETEDGHELTFQVNHLAPFLLTNLLLERLLSSQAVVVNTSSAANKLFARFDVEDLELRRRYRPERAYGNAKLANILFTTELERRFGDQGVHSAAFHPGVVATSFAAGSTSAMRHVYGSVLNRFLLSPENGADTLVWLATTSPGEDWLPGGYYSKRRLTTAAKAAYDPAASSRLWERSLEMTGLAGSGNGHRIL
ncbi:SDR family NAD(P)-dependent oxidoreductase [Arthrobacter sp.]|uniref:SDR family NAD(P)-dependent oxidoreductase n=1 Tax=Arthrobacter sp. TaxID=1667 RepID=UPI0028A1EEDE|nr:SDR family NAD(P)-dependent oxidoreductase [Arthrobacter sp.]